MKNRAAIDIKVQKMGLKTQNKKGFKREVGRICLMVKD